jgi:hypothetical protein
VSPDVSPSSAVPSGLGSAAGQWNGPHPAGHAALAVRAEGERRHGREPVARVERVGADVARADSHDREFVLGGEGLQVPQVRVHLRWFTAGAGEDRDAEWLDSPGARREDKRAGLNPGER